MKVAIQTIAWKSNPKSIPAVLREAKEAGYDGVEMFQHPSRLLQKGGMREFYQLLVEENELVFVGLAGGSVKERVKFVQEFEQEQSRRREGYAKTRREAAWTALHRPYVYVDSKEDLAFWKPKDAPAVRMALHPHMFRSVQTLDDASRLLDKYPWLEFLPDTAHLKIAGENPVEAIERYVKRLAAIHLKDWIPEFGRSYQFYGRGFTELGQGDVGLEAVIELLARVKYDGWLVVEKDIALQPQESARQARNWLRELGI